MQRKYKEYTQMQVIVCTGSLVLNIKFVPYDISICSLFSEVRKSFNILVLGSLAS